MDLAALKRFEAAIVKGANGCRELRTHLHSQTGRAYFQLNHRRYIAARWYWQTKRGSLRGEQCVLHRCDNPACVNLDHLFIGTQHDNIRDRDTKNRGKEHVTHCRNGHKFDGPNTILWGPGKRWRACRKCGREAVSRYKRRLMTRREAEEWS